MKTSDTTVYPNTSNADGISSSHYPIRLYFIFSGNTTCNSYGQIFASYKKRPREAVVSCNFRSTMITVGNTYSDVFLVAALVQSVGELEFGQQSAIYLPSLLKRFDRLLQFDRSN